MLQSNDSDCVSKIVNELFVVAVIDFLYFIIQGVNLGTLQRGWFEDCVGQIV